LRACSVAGGNIVSSPGHKPGNSRTRSRFTRWPVRSSETHCSVKIVPHLSEGDTGARHLAWWQPATARPDRPQNTKSSLTAQCRPMRLCLIVVTTPGRADGGQDCDAGSRDVALMTALDLESRRRAGLVAAAPVRRPINRWLVSSCGSKPPKTGTNRSHEDSPRHARFSSRDAPSTCSKRWRRPLHQLIVAGRPDTLAASANERKFCCGKSVSTATVPPRRSASVHDQSCRQRLCQIVHGCPATIRPEMSFARSSHRDCEDWEWYPRRRRCFKCLLREE
jgi:hypothetical protein